MSQERWWQVIEAMAGYVAGGFDYDDLEGELVHRALMDQGFTYPEIDSALDWLEMASVSGNVAEVISMLQPTATGIRVASPLEKAFISDRMWSQFEKMRVRGIISYDLAEKLLEGIRTLDTRDWEDEEINIFIQEVLTTTLPAAPESFLKGLAHNRIDLSEFYS